MANLYHKLFRSHSSSEGKDFMYLKHNDTSKAVVYRGREGLRLKNPFSNPHTKGSFPNEAPFSGLGMEDSTDLAVLTEK